MHLSNQEQALKEAWIDQAVFMLENGDSQISIITYLRSQGVSDDLAKELSYDVFAAARKKLRKKQRPHRIIAWSLIALGFILPLALFLAGWIVIYSIAPAIAGMGYLAKLPKPKSLPRETTLLK